MTFPISAVLSEVEITGAEELGIVAVIAAIALFGLIAVIFVKSTNVFYGGEFYDLAHIFTTLILGSIFFGLVLFAALIHNIVSFAVYLNVAVALYSIVWVLFIVEIILLMGVFMVKGRLRSEIGRNKSFTDFFNRS